MINGNIVNGNTINGDSGNDFFKNISENLSISESINVAHDFNFIPSESLKISENVSFYFNKGRPINEGLSISESLDIRIGNLIYHIDDDPVKISESISFNLKKGVLMQEEISYYINLLILQYRNKAKAKAHVTALIKQALIDLMPLILQDCFNLDTATGVQLDILGKYIGMTRRVKTFDADVTLNDDDYRYLLKIKRATNNIGSSLYDIQSFVQTNLPNVFKVFDHANMTLSFYLSQTVISNTLGQAIIKENLLPKPMGVGYSTVVFIPNFDNIFGFRTYTFDSGQSIGFNRYTSYNSDTRFLSYQDTIT